MVLAQPAQANLTIACEGAMITHIGSVAQLDRASPSEGEGCWFESSQSHHYPRCPAIAGWAYFLEEVSHD